MPMVARSVMGFPFGPVAHPSAGTLVPAVTDPLWRYPKAAETVHAMSKVWRMNGCDCVLADSSLVCGRRRVDEVLSFFAFSNATSQADELFVGLEQIG